MKKINLIVRKLWKNKMFTFLNIIGLAIGISACWIVFRIVNYEFSFDKHHPNQEKIFKVYGEFEEVNRTEYFDGVPTPLSRYIKENLSTVEYTVPVYRKYFPIISNTSDSKNPILIEDQQDIIETTNDYFKMVPYEWLAGNQQHVFQNPNEVVLTASRAKGYFPNLDAKEMVGKTLMYDTVMFSVAGVVKDLEHPSSFLGKEFMNVSAKDWNSENWQTFMSDYTLYVQLKNLKHKSAFVDQASKKVFEMNEEDFIESGSKTGIGITPLTDVHFDENLQGSTNIKILYGLIGIGGFLMLLAAINYINLTTAQVPYRAKEIGIRKTLGEQPFDVSKSFFFETLIITSIALLLSFPLTKVFEKTFTSFLPENMNSFSDQWPVIFFILGLLLFVTFISSIYPVYLINKVQISEVIKMKGIGKLSLGSISLRKVLIVFQFVIAQIFVIATFVMGLQMKHTMQSDLGFNYNAIVTFQLPFKKHQNGDVDPYVFKSAIEKHSQIDGITLGHFPLSRDHWGNSVSTSADTGMVKVNMPVKFIDNDYLKVYEIKLLAGRTLSVAIPALGFC